MYLNAWRLTERQDLCIYPSILASTHPPPQPRHPLLHPGRKYSIFPPTEMFPRQSSPLWSLVCPLGPFTTVVLVFLHVWSSPTFHAAAIISCQGNKLKHGTPVLIPATVPLHPWGMMLLSGASLLLRPSPCQLALSPLPLLTCLALRWVPESFASGV